MNRKKQTPWRCLSWAIVAVLASCGLARAQETSGSLTGVVTDTQGATVPGATITITSAQGTRSVVTDGSGRFLAPYLTPGKYNVRVEISGFTAVEQKNIDVRLGQRLELSGLVLKVGGVEEVVEVTGAAPVVDVSSTTVGGILSGEMIKKLPVGRNITDTLYLVPGVSDSSGAGRANPSIGGASGLENSYVIDGVNVSNSGFGAFGSYSRTYGSLGTGVTADFVKETQIKSGGFEAEYGQATGGVVNVLTQSGTNELHGAVFGYWEPSWAASDWRQIETANGALNTQARETADVGLSLGGPLVQNKLFFFGTFNPSFQTHTFEAPPDFPLQSLGPVDRKRRSYSYAGKLTFQASPNHRFEFSAFGDPSTGPIGPQRSTALLADSPTRFSSIRYGGHNQVLKYDAIMSPSWFAEVTLGRSSSSVAETPSTDRYSMTDTTVVPNVRSGGIGFYEDDTSSNHQASIKFTNIFNAGGNHQVRYGVSVEDIDYFQGTQRTGPTFTLPDGQKTTTGAAVSVLADPVFGKIYRVTRANLTPGRDTNQRYYSAFLQDTWTVGRFMFRPGLRYDYQRMRGSENPGFCYEGTARVGEQPLPGQDFGEPIPCEYTFKGNWAPRIGATYDLTGVGKAKVFASYGRFYVKIPNDLAARALSVDAQVARADYFDAELTRPVPNGTVAAGVTDHYTLAGAFPAVFDTKIKSTYSDEFLGGVEFEAAPGLNLGVRYINRRIPVVMEDVGLAQVLLYSQLASIEYFVTNVTEKTPTYDPADFGQTFAQATFEDPVHKYQALELTASKSFSNNFSLLASYRYAKLEGNFEGFYRSDNGQSDPAISSLFDFATNDPSYVSVGVAELGFRGDIRYQGTTLGTGVLPNDRPHQFKLYTNYTMNALNVGLGLNAGSGRSLTALATNPAYENTGEIPETLRGAGIQTVEDGFRKRSKTEFVADLHLDYTFRLGGRKLVLLADTFNLLNNRSATDYNNYTETDPGVLDPDFGYALNSGSVTPSYRAPRQIRLGARIEW